MATIDYVAGESSLLGEPSRVERGKLLVRDTLVAHLRVEAPERRG